MSLTLALNNALSGLKVNQAALAVISNNIANANTAGYSRQIVDQSAQVLAGVGAGVKIDDISRKVDKYLERSIQRETSSVSRTDRVVDYYQRVQILLGEPGSTNSIDEYVGQYFNSLQSLAETPDRVSFQASAVNSGETLARELSGLAQSLQDLRYQADQDIKEAVGTVNNELAHLDSLNISINRAKALGTSTASLLDQRDISLEKLSQYLDIDVTFQDSGAVSVYTANGVALVDDDIHQLAYRPVSGVNSFVNGSAVNPLQVLSLDDNGNQVRDPDNIILGGVEKGVVSKLKGGEIQGLQELRDQLIPDVLSQLDVLASRLRDEVNAIHNDGSSFPPPTTLTGTRSVAANEAFDWSGKVLIGALNPDGTPAASTYSSESYTGYRPLSLDFSFLDSGQGAGKPTTQTIIDEINNHFNAPPVKARVNNLSNVQLVSNTDQLPAGTPPIFNFDLDLDNLSNTTSSVWVTNVTVLDDTATNITGGGVTSTIPKVPIDFANAYNFNAGSNLVTITSLASHGLAVGDRVYLPDSGALPGNFASNGISSTEVVGYFEVVGVTSSNQFQIRINTTSGVTSTESAGAAIDALPPYHEVAAGDKERARNSGTISTNLSLNTASAYYDITLEVGVYNNDPANPKTDLVQLTYRVYNNNTNLRNDRYDIASLTGNGTREFPTTPHQYIFAQLVDADGNELPKVNGSYGTQEGFVKLVTNPLNGQNIGVSINEGDSKQLGKLSLTPPEKGTNRGFSHYFELNNFFASNKPTTTGDTVAGSAYNFHVEQRLIDNPSLVTTGDLQRSNQPADPAAKRLYTYERFNSDNSVIQRLAQLNYSSVSFEAAGGLPSSNQSFSGYIGEVLGYNSTQTVSAENQLKDNQTLLDGFVNRSDAISGVNLDEELANTVIFQNAYAASARIITATNELFDALLKAV